MVDRPLLSNMEDAFDLWDSNSGNSPRIMTDLAELDDAASDPPLEDSGEDGCEDAIDVPVDSGASRQCPHVIKNFIKKKNKSIEYHTHHHHHLHLTIAHYHVYRGQLLSKHVNPLAIPNASTAMPTRQEESDGGKPEGRGWPASGSGSAEAVGLRRLRAHEDLGVFLDEESN